MILLWCRCPVVATATAEFAIFAAMSQVDTTEVPDFTTMYELYDPVTVMFFYRCAIGFP